MRHVFLGRKNYQFVASVRGGEVAANLYSLIYSCKALGVDPEAYLADVLTAVATTPSSQVAMLTPWEWAERHPEAVVQAAYATS